MEERGDFFHPYYITTVNDSTSSTRNPAILSASFAAVGEWRIRPYPYKRYLCRMVDRIDGLASSGSRVVQATSYHYPDISFWTRRIRAYCRRLGRCILSRQPGKIDMVGVF